MRHLPLARLARAAALATLALLAASCGQEAPKGAILRLTFLNVRASAVDSLRVSLTPEPGQRFQMRPTQTIDGVTVEVESDGTLVLTLPGDEVRARAIETDAAGLRPQVDLEVWSDDRTMNRAPFVRATVTQGADLIAQGAGYVSDWPLVLGSVSPINVQCNMGSMAACQRM